MPCIIDWLKSDDRCFDIILAIDLSDLVSMLSVPGPLLESSLRISSYTSLSVVVLKINWFLIFVLNFIVDLEVEGISSLVILGSFSASFSATVA